MAKGEVRSLPNLAELPNGRVARLFELDNGRGLRMRVTDLGGTVLQLFAPNRAGRSDNVLLVPDGVAGILSKKSPFFGSLVGRVANRIAYGKFALDGDHYTLPTNNGQHSLHGGGRGYNVRLWDAQPQSGAALKLTLVDDSTPEGYAGIVNVSVVYTLTPAGTWRIAYEATTDAPTPINLTQHAYFNLKDAGRSDMLGHVVRIDAQEFTPVDANLIPTGQLKSVEGTPMDFRKPKPVGQDLGKIDATPRGYDHNFVIAGAPGPLREIAEVYEPTTGRRMVVRTTEPGVQLYTGNFLDGSLKDPAGEAYQQYAGLCLETQHFPDSPNQPNFPGVILRPDAVFTSVTEYEFSAE